MKSRAIVTYLYVTTLPCCVYSNVLTKELRKSRILKIWKFQAYLKITSTLHIYITSARTFTPNCMILRVAGIIEMVFTRFFRFKINRQKYNFWPIKKITPFYTLHRYGASVRQENKIENNVFSKIKKYIFQIFEKKSQKYIFEPI